MNFTFGSSYFLLLLLLLPCLLWCRQYTKRFYFPKIAWIKRESALFTLEFLLKVLIYALLVFGLANPYIYNPNANNHKKGRDLILAIDASGSMAQSGFNRKDTYQSKYEALLQLSQEFIKHRADDNIGVVIFGTFAYSASPLTYDLSSLSDLLGMTTVGVAGESTAIGDALAESIDSLSFGEAKNRVIILLTDGYHNAGSISPKQAATKAKEQSIKIYTIGIGSKGTYDANLLKRLSKESGGQSFGVKSAEDLEKVYKQIERLEPSDIRSENFLNRELLYSYPLLVVFGLLLFWVMSKRGDSL